jgi:sialate O-acetylesterase
MKQILKLSLIATVPGNEIRTARIVVFFMAILFLSIMPAVDAKVKLPAIVSSNMVLQRDATVNIWGWAEGGEKISMEASWLNEELEFEANTDGNWSVELRTTNSKEPQTIIIKSKTSEIILENVLFGEVWLCSGQSNMVRTLRASNAQPVYGSVMAIANSSNPNLRLFNVGRTGSEKPLQDIEEYTGWQQSSPDAVATFSAIGYFFGKQLQEILDVPVGIIVSAYGASSVQAWMSKESISPYQEVNLENQNFSRGPNRIPTALFNAMINPIIPYTIKGALWYQGESNRMQPENYKILFPAMVKDWRDRWEIGDFPFYYVQIAPFLYGNNDAFQEVNNSAFMREAQLGCLDLIPNSGIAIAMDLGDKISIHPPRKKEVADRLLLNALNQTYGYTTIDYASPIYDTLNVQDGGIILKFKNARSGLYSYNGLEGFEIAGGDRVFYPANASIVNRREVFVKNDLVPNPVAVRYAWRNWIEGTLYNAHLFPASSFRTDDWDDATKVENKVK